MLTIPSNMLHSLKPFHCPSCNYCFTSRDTARIHNVSRFPLILKCGHTVCESCLRNSVKNHEKIICSVCQKCTDFENGSVPKLLPDIYVLGIVSANLKQALPSLKMRLVPTSPSMVNGMQQEKRDALVVCDNCSLKEASFRCEKCEENFCNTCFDSFHKSRGKNLKKHVGVPVYTHVYSSAVQGGCPVHDNHAIEFYCEEDNELICSLCVVTGDHKGHPVFTLLEKNKSCAGDLRKAREEATLINRRLKFTEQKLAQAIPSEKIDNSQWIKEIHNHFHCLHTALTLRENQLISQMEDISQASVSQLEKMRQEISDSFKDLEAVLRDAELAIENPALSISVPSVIKKLESARTIPCHLIPITSSTDDEKGISLEFDPVLQEIIMKHGKISAEIKPKFCLKTTDQLPPDFVVEPLVVEAFPLDAESFTSDSFSDDSLGSNLNFNQSSNLCLPLKVEPFFSKQEKVHVSHIHDPTSFFVVRSSESRKLRTLHDKINRWCRSSDAEKHIPKTVKQGDLYLVRYSADNKWYRGRVKRIISAHCDTEVPVEGEYQVPKDSEVVVGADMKVEQRAEIFYIDFGNSEIVPLSRIRNIQTQFLNLCGMAKHCSLSDIVPVNGKSWTIDAINTFNNFVHDKEVNMQVMENRNNILYVDLSQAAATDVINDVPVSVRDALVFLEHGSFIADTRTAKSKRNRNIRHFPPHEELRANTKATVLVSHVDSPSSFYVQQRATSRHLSDLILEMKQVYSDETNILHAVYVPYIGMMCAAQYKKDQFWYRAEVVCLPGGAKVEVQYIDFGNREVLHHRYIRKLLDRFTKLNTQAIPCTLADATYFEGTGWSEEAKDWFTNYVEKKHLTLLSLGMVSSSKVTKAVLYESEDASEVCVNALMVSKNLASSTGTYSKVVKVPKPKMVTQTPKSSITSSSPPSTVPASSPSAVSEIKLAEASVPTESLVSKEKPENHVEVYVSHIDTPGRFFVRIADIEHKYTRLMNVLQDVYRDFDCIPTEINIGCSYAVFREANKTWYRGIALQEMADNFYQVRFVDIGFVEVISSKNFRILLKQHGVDEAFAIECHLAFVVPAGDSNKWPQIAVDTFKDLVSPHDILYLVGEDCIENNSLPSDLFSKQVIRGGALEPSRVNFQSIRECLVEKGVALRVRKNKVPSPMKNEPQCLSPSSTCSADTYCSSGTVVPQPEDSENSPNKESTVQTTMEIISRPSTPREPTFRWKKALLPTEMQFACRPSHVGDDGHIFIQVKPDGTAKVDLIGRALDFKYSDATPEKLRVPPPVGEAVAARFPMDKKWYRAEIVSDNPDRIKVQFVDFGNYEFVDLDDIRLDVIRRETPCQALECELFDTKPVRGKSWPSEVLDFIHETVVDQDCMVEVHAPPEEGKALQVSLTLEGDINVSDLMKDIGKAVSCNQYEERIRSELAVDPPLVPEESRNIRYRKASSLQLNKPFRVCVTQLLEPNIICLQWLKIENPTTEDEKAHNLELTQFLELMNELSERAESFPKLSNPQTGHTCCAKYTYDNNWYRCEVEGISSDGIQVFYVDYGNAEVLPLERLRGLEPRFLEFPVQAHICKIHGLQPIGDSWSTEATEAVLNKLFFTSTDVYANVVVPGEVCEVDLFVMDSNGDMQLFYMDIVEKGLVKLSRS